MTHCQIVDLSVAGSRYDTLASPSLAHFLRSTAQEIPHPTDPGRTLWDARDDKGPYYQPGDDELHAMSDEHKGTMDGTIGVGYLGSGSDFTVFLQHIGVSPLSLSLWFYASATGSRLIPLFFYEFRSRVRTPTLTARQGMQCTTITPSMTPFAGWTSSAIRASRATLRRRDTWGCRYSGWRMG